MDTETARVVTKVMSVRTETARVATNVISVRGPSASGDTLLSAGAGNGIVAIDDGGLWSGASGLVLPWP